MKNLILVIVIFLTGSVFGQVSMTAGGSTLFGIIRDAKPWGGFHIGLEIPRDDQTSFYIRYTHHFKQHMKDSTFAWLTPKDPLNFEYPVINGLTSVNYNIIEGGTRYYLGDGFDFGWAAYGGTNVMFIVNSIKDNYDDYDEALYALDDMYRYSGTFFWIGAGLGGGVKYTAPRYGTFYLDLNLNYILIGQPSTPVPDLSLISPLIFNINLGYRKDLIW